MEVNDNEEQKISVDRQSAPIVETPTSVSYLGVNLEKAGNPNGRFVPKKENYDDFINDEFSLKMQREIAVSFLQGDPILIEGGTSIGKTTTVRKMAADLGWEVHYANLNGATDVEDLMGRYIPNPNKHKPDDPEYIFADGKVTSGLRQEDGKVKVIVLDEFNSAAPNILIRLHEVLDALDRGEDLVLSEDASEVVKVSSGSTKIVALMNPPGKGYFGREPLDPAQLRRWVYTKVPTDLPEKTFSHATDALFSLVPKLQDVPGSSYLLSRETTIMPEDLQDIPGIKEILAKYKEFHKAAKQMVKERSIAADQPQPFMFDDRMEPRRVRDFLLAFYNGDLNETMQSALRYYYANKLDSPEDKNTLEELIRHVEYVEPLEVANTKRRGLYKQVSIGPETSVADHGSFSPEQRKRLEDLGYVILSLRGEKTINIINKNPHWSFGKGGIQINEVPSNWHSQKGEVAIAKSTKFIGTPNKTLKEHVLDINFFSTTIAKTVPGVKAIMGTAGDYVELASAYEEKTFESLFVAPSVFAMTGSVFKPPSFMIDQVACVGRFDLYPNQVAIAIQDPTDRTENVFSLPIVVPA